MHEVNGEGQAEELVEGTVKVGPHGEGCTCDATMAEMSATVVIGTCIRFVQENAERFAAVGLDVPNFLAGKSVTELPTEAEKLITSLVSEGLLAGLDFAELLAPPPVYSYFGDINSLDAMLDIVLAEEAPYLAE